MKLQILVLIATLLAVSLAACDNGDDTQTINVDLSELAVKASATTVAPGYVLFKPSNKGSLPHEMVVIKTDLAVDALPVEDAKVVEARTGELIGEIEPDELGPGASREKTLELKAGKYALICNIAGHYQNGMRAALEVK